jgi:hypothetical protein
MGWKFSQFTSGVLNAFKEIDVLGTHQSSVDDIRQEMFAHMVSIIGEQANKTTLWRSIDAARDAQTLWYLRSDLMAFLSVQKGEPFAKEQLRAITKNFKGQVPNAQFESAMRARNF